MILSNFKGANKDIIVMWLILIFCSGKKSSWIREKSSPMFGYANSMSGLADGMSFTWAISILCQCHATLYYSK